MSDSYVKDPRDVVKSGDIVRVKVLDVDTVRKRISLTLRLDDEVGGGRRDGGRRPGGRDDASGIDGAGPQGERARQDPRRREDRGRREDRAGRGRQPDRSPPGGALADALRRAGYGGAGGGEPGERGRRR